MSVPVALALHCSEGMRLSHLATLLVCALAGACVGSIDGGEGPLEPDPDDPGDPGGGGPDEDCPSVRVELVDTVPSVMLLVDRSGTMDADFANTSRWWAVYDTLFDETAGVVKRLEQEVRFGMALYTAYNGVCPIIEQMAPAMGNYQQLRGLYELYEPVDETPTAVSIDAMVTTLNGIQETGPKIIVVATDGEPDTCAVPDPDGLPEARSAAVGAAQRAHEAGIDLYIISVGDQIAQSHLQDMANAGVGKSVGGTDNAPYYQAFNADALVGAFDSIIGGVRSCSFGIEGQVDPDQAEYGTVTLDGRELTFGTEWQLSDQSTLELLGEACAAVMAGDHTVEAEFTCGAIVD
jgi:hypothetical protein